MSRTSLASVAFRLDFLLENENMGLIVSEVLPVTPQPLGPNQKLSPFQLLHSTMVRGISWQEGQSGIYPGGPEVNTE